MEKQQPDAPDVLLASDIDKTLVMTSYGDPPNLPFELLRYLRDSGIALMEVTGMTWERTRLRIAFGEVPFAPLVATDGGTQLRRLYLEPPDEPAEMMGLKIGEDGQPFWAVVDQGYQEWLDKTHPFDREEVIENVADVLTSELGRELNADFQDISHQLPNGPGRVNIFAYDPSPDARGVNELVKLLAEKTGKQIVWAETKLSKDEAADGRGHKYSIDVVQIGKDGVVKYVANELEARRVLIAGDGGNDFEMMDLPGGVKIVVGGSQPDLMDRVNERLRTGRVQLGEPGVAHRQFRGTRETWYIEPDSNKKGPASLLEGLRATENSWLARPTAGRDILVPQQRSGHSF